MTQLFEDAPQNDTAGAPGTEDTGGGNPGEVREPEKAAEEKPEPDKTPDKTPDKAPGYADFSLPEGFSAAPEILAEFKDMAGKMGLTQEQAQSLVDLQVRTQQGAVEAWTRQRSEWRREMESDPEYGQDKLRDTIRDARLVLDRYDPAGVLLAELEKSGHGDNPAIIRFLAQIGREHLREDSVFTDRAAPGGEEKPLRDRLWPDEVMPK
ncbi:MAG: hypothetical protein LBO77_03660, partial [Desulfovibrio sp.]|nr:hypothetical protein [Desulfovibrio sp.]